MQRRVPAIIMRGGTSRGVFFHERNLPTDEAARDRIILAALGSPDPYGRQIDGLGGATSSTSKVVIVAPSGRSDADVEYTFGQVSITEQHIGYSGNCGNLTSAVGPFAIDEGLVAGREPATLIRLFNRNTNKIIVANVPVCDGEAAVAGDYAIDGIPRPGARIELTYQDPGGAGTGKLLPSGNVVDRIPDPDGGTIEASIVDASNPVVFVHANVLGLSGAELPEMLNRDAVLLERLEAIRCAAGAQIGYDSPRRNPLGIAFITTPRRYITSKNAEVQPEQVDIVARVVSDGRVHHAYTGTGSICTAVAGRIPGTIVNQIVRADASGYGTVRIGHAAGIIEIGVEMTERNGQSVPASVTTFRTARRLMRGELFVPSSVL
jgi:2-methylaconitate cis-trans-isomerase PrpF